MGVRSRLSIYRSIGLVLQKLIGCSIPKVYRARCVFFKTLASSLFLFGIILFPTGRASVEV